MILVRLKTMSWQLVCMFITVLLTGIGSSSQIILKGVNTKLAGSKLCNKGGVDNKNLEWDCGSETQTKTCNLALVLILKTLNFKLQVYLCETDHSICFFKPCDFDSELTWAHIFCCKTLVIVILFQDFKIILNFLVHLKIFFRPCDQHTNNKERKRKETKWQTRHFKHSLNDRKGRGVCPQIINTPH